MHPIPSAVVALVAMGCRGPIPVAVTPASIVEGGLAISYEVEASTGAAPHTVTVRATNAYGVPTAGVAVTLDVSGTSEQVTFDAHGVGSFVIETPGTYVVTGAGDPATIQVLDTAWDGLVAMPSMVAPTVGATSVRMATGGALVAAGGEVWFVGTGGRAHRVLATEDPVTSVRTGHLDADGVVDGVVTTADTVFLLRGVAGGGMSWGTAFRADGFTVGGAAIGDVSDDSNGDVVIAWAGGADKHYVDFWEGDGLWSWSAAPPRLMLDKPIDLSLGDQLADDSLQVTVLHDGGNWARFVLGEPGFYIPIGPILAELVITGTRVEARGDVNGDGADELAIIDQTVRAGNVQILLFDLLGEAPEYVPMTVLGAEVDITDTNGDGHVDVMTLDSTNQVESTLYNGTNYPQHLGGAVPEHGPIAFGKLLLGDDVPEMLLAGDAAWTWYTGGTELSSDIWWVIEPPAPLDAGPAATGPLVATDLDGDPSTGEMVGFAIENDTTSLKVWETSPGVGLPATEAQTYSLSGGSPAPLDLAVCDGVAWVLIDGALVRIDLNSMTFTGTFTTDATRIDCGPEHGATKAVMLVDDQIVSLNDALAQLGSTAAGGAVDVAMVVLNGSPLVETCTEVGCTVTRWVLETEHVAVVGGTTVSAKAGDGTTTLAGAGMVTATDVDGNGSEDLVVASADGAIWVYRAMGDGWTSASTWLTGLDLANPPAAAPATDDAQPDLWVVSSDHLYVVPSGSAVETVESPGDTDDTDSP